MNVIRAAGELRNPDRPVSIAIGVFDGVHRGHQEVLNGALRKARLLNGLAVAVTFDRHPNAVVAPAKTPPSIQTVSQKLRAINALGFDATLLLEFSESFSAIAGEDFIRSLAADFGFMKSVSVGEGFTFGHKRSGDVALLRRLGANLSFEVEELAPLASDGQVISSTRIREEIRGGNFKAASGMLGRPYAIEGIVEQGDRIGHQLGFPTANLQTLGLVLPPYGVYAVRVGDASAVMNLGVRPSLTGIQPELRVEVHLLDFEGDLYGDILEITPIQKLREELRFESLDALRAQIVRDIQLTRTVLEKSK